MIVSAWYWYFWKNGLLFLAHVGESLVEYLCSHMAHYKLGWAGWCERHCLCSVFAFEVFHSRLMARWGRGEPWACVCLYIRGNCGHICQIPAFWLPSAWRGGTAAPQSQPPTPMDSLDFMKYTRMRGEPGGAAGSGETTAIFLFQEIE